MGYFYFWVIFGFCTWPIIIQFSPFKSKITGAYIWYKIYHLTWIALLHYLTIGRRMLMRIFAREDPADSVGGWETPSVSKTCTSLWPSGYSTCLDSDRTRVQFKPRSGHLSIFPGRIQVEYVLGQKLRRGLSLGVYNKSPTPYMGWTGYTAR